MGIFEKLGKNNVNPLSFKARTCVKNIQCIAESSIKIDHTTPRTLFRFYVIRHCQFEFRYLLSFYTSGGERLSESTVIMC